MVKMEMIKEIVKEKERKRNSKLNYFVSKLQNRNIRIAFLGQAKAHRRLTFCFARDHLSKPEKETLNLTPVLVLKLVSGGSLSSIWK